MRQFGLASQPKASAKATSLPELVTIQKGQQQVNSWLAPALTHAMLYRASKKEASKGKLSLCVSSLRAQEHETQLKWSKPMLQSTINIPVGPGLCLLREMLAVLMSGPPQTRSMAVQPLA